MPLTRWHVAHAPLPSNTALPAVDVADGRRAALASPRPSADTRRSARPALRACCWPASRVPGMPLRMICTRSWSVIARRNCAAARDRCPRLRRRRGRGSSRTCRETRARRPRCRRRCRAAARAVTPEPVRSTRDDQNQRGRLGCSHSEIRGMPAHLTPFRAKLSRLRPDSTRSCDVAIVGAGAAGLATAIFTRPLNAGRSVLLLDGARRPGAKILVSGGSRCNVTNAVVTDTDFWGGRRTIIRRVLRAFPVRDTIAFFREIGVALHEEADGKLFPDSQPRARRARRAAATRRSARRRRRSPPSTRVLDVERDGDGFRVATSRGDIHAAARRARDRRAVAAEERQRRRGLRDRAAAGPHDRADDAGAGAAAARDAATESIHRELSGVAHAVELDALDRRRGRDPAAGSLLWTHFGISGPVALNMSRHWLRARLEGRAVVAHRELLSRPDVRRRRRAGGRRARRSGPQTSVMTALVDDRCRRRSPRRILRSAGDSTPRRRSRISRATIAGGCRTR